MNYQHLVILLQEVEMILLSVVEREDLVREGDESMTITLRGDIIHHTVVDVAEDGVGDGITTIEDVHDLIRDIPMILGGDIVAVAMVEMVMTGMVVHNNIIIVPRKVKVVVVV